MKQPISLTFVTSIYRTASSARTPWHKTRSSDLRAKNQFQLEDSQKNVWHGTYLYAIYKSAIVRDLSFFHRFALIKKMAWQFFVSSLETATQCVFLGRKRPCEMMIFGPGPIGGLNSRSWVSGKVSNALEMRGASYDARNTRSGLLAYIHTPRVWFVGHMAHGSRFPKLWPPHLPQILP